MKTKLLFSGLLFFTLFFAFGCKQPTDDADLTYTLTADKYEVGINEEVTFTVMSSKGEDVTDKWQLCDDGSCFGTVRTLKWSTPGTVKVKAQMAENTTIVTKPVEITISGSVYMLSADKLTIYEREAVKFSVTEIKDGVELDKKPANFQVGIKGDPERFQNMENIFPKAGVYTIDGWKLDYITGEIGIRTQNTLEIIVKKKGSSGNSDDFYRRSLVTEYTGTWCNTCPNMIKVLDNTMNYIDYERFVIAAFHWYPDGPPKDDCNVEYLKPFDFMLEDFGFATIPSYVVDWNRSYAKQNVGDLGGGGVTAKAKELAHSIEASQARYGGALTPGIALETSLSGRNLNVNVKITPREAAEYYLGLLFIEDNLETYQNGAPGETMMQMNVVHKSITKGDTRYEVESLGELTANQESSFEYNLNNIADRYNLTNCRVIAYVCKKDLGTAPSGYFCANVATVKLGQSLGYKYEPIIAE